MRFGLLTGRQEGVTQGFLANGGHSVLRLRRTVRTWVIAESQGNGGFSLADSQSLIGREVSPARMVESGIPSRADSKGPCTSLFEKQLPRWEK